MMKSWKTTLSAAVSALSGAAWLLGWVPEQVAQSIFIGATTLIGLFASDKDNGKK
jgi:2-methylcitrate dehydratase PrpD